MGEALQMFELVDDHGRCQLLQNSDQRKIYLCVDALSPRNFPCLRSNLTKKLTELESSDYVLAQLESLSCFVCVHDFLHETRLHRQDTIWKAMYGGFLQAFQYHLGWKLDGNPAKNKLQRHEQFLLLLGTALRRHRMTCFLATADGKRVVAEWSKALPQNGLVAFDASFDAFCRSWESSEDEPTRGCALLLKYLDSYKCCIGGVKRGNWWMLEVQGAKWLGGWKVAGKSNYVTETLHQMDSWYGNDMSDEELEWTGATIYVS